MKSKYFIGVPYRQSRLRGYLRQAKLRVIKFLKEQGVSTAGLKHIQCIKKFAELRGYPVPTQSQSYEWLVDMYIEKIDEVFTSPRYKTVIRRKSKSKPPVAAPDKPTSIPSVSFYMTKPWRSLRKKVLNYYGVTCMKCGFRHVKNHVDHIKPRVKYPHLELVISNLQVLCEKCNTDKGWKDETDYRPRNKPLLG